jgi:hypothetical protein
MATNLDNTNGITPIEQKLASTLKPVRPSPAFVRTTRHRFSFASPTVVAQRLGDKDYLLLLLAGFIGTALFIITIARLIYSLLGRNK